MDFLIGIVIFAIIVLFLINYASVTLSDSNTTENNAKCNTNTTATTYNNNPMNLQYITSNAQSVPSSTQPNINIFPNGYEYQKYFFV